jgi:DNA polymerase type B, organellar and viral
MSKCITLPGLAMKIYKTHYMPKDSIYQLLGKVEKDIRSSFTGGAVDVYKTNNRDNIYSDLFDKLYYYDFNSLYPSVMAMSSMPIGKPIYFEGDILKIDPEAFGFFYCKITSPDYLEHPILQRRIKTKNGLRTVAGLGSWKGFIFSEEMKNAQRFGYTFEIIRGYEFQKGDLFSEYVNKMYDLRLQYDKSEPMNYIAKLLMNSLYGKLAMKITRSRVDIYDCSDESGKNHLQAIIDLYSESIEDYIQIDNSFLIVRDTLANIKFDEENDMYHGLEVNVAISSAITSYSRVYMTAFKNNKNFNLYYSDTDSIIIDKELPERIIGNKLGQLKLEHVIERGVFLAPKVYGFINDKDEKIIKVKGLKSEITESLTINDLKVLLFKDASREFIQEKWFKKLFLGELTTKDVIYTLKVNSNKRLPIYKDNVFIETKPYNYSDLE